MRASGYDVAAWRRVLFHHGQADFSRVTQDAEAVQEPDDDRDHDNEVENGFNRRSHGDVGVDEPQQHANDDQGEDDSDKRHKGPLVLVRRDGSRILENVYGV